MDPLVVAAAVVVPGLAVLGWVAIRNEISYRRDRRRMWTEALEATSLEHLTDESGRESGRELGLLAFEGVAAGRLVRVESYERGKGADQGACIRIASSSDLSLGREGFGALLGKAFGRSELQLGHEAFDRNVLIEGPEDQARAVLDAEARPRILDFIRGEVGIQGIQPSTAVHEGAVVAEFARPMEELLFANLETILGRLLDVARRLDRPADLLGRIVENNRREADGRVRFGNVGFLAEAYRGQAAVRDALVDACRDPVDEVRLRAAVAVGEPGRETLLQIASSRFETPQAPRALAALGEHLPLERGLEILGHALRGRHIHTARACMETLGRVGGAAVVDPLVKVLAVEKGELGVAAALALGASRAPEAEGPLLRTLAGDSADLAAAAAEALGHVGSAAAVLPLQEASARTGEDVLRRAARTAVARIQSRLQGATPGQLSISEGDAGQLSLAGEDPAGRVSLPDHDAGPPTRGSER